MSSLRSLRRTHPFDAPVASRTEVCPPALLEAADSGFRRWLKRLGAPGLAGPQADPLKRLLQVREDFARALDGVDTQHAQYLQHRLRHQRSLRELWHLRPEMFVLIAQAFSESEARQRLGALDRHFPSRGD